MSKDIEAAALTDFEIASDGTGVRMNLRDSEGQAASLTLPSECINQLLMTLPSMARLALRARYGDGTLRIVYPIGQWTIERAGGHRAVVVTFGTPDGFEVSFSLSRDQCESLSETLAELPIEEHLWQTNRH
jgi:hypothetical protein